jgi:hypothetical protein
MNNTVASNQMATHLYFNVTFNNTQSIKNGEHSGISYCCDGTNCGFATFSFNITPNGEEPTEGKAIFYIGALILLVIFLVLSVYGFTKFETPTMKLLFGYCIYLVMVGISYISWVMSTNFLTATQFIGRFFWIIFLFLMIMFFPMMIVSVIWYVWLLVSIKQIKDMIERGVPEDEAYARSVRRGGFFTKR